jgi:hypothetical protein
VVFVLVASGAGFGLLFFLLFVVIVVVIIVVIGFAIGPIIVVVVVVVLVFVVVLVSTRALLLLVTKTHGESGSGALSARTGYSHAKDGQRTPHRRYTVSTTNSPVAVHSLRL